MENQQKFEWNPNFSESVNTTELDAFLSGWGPQTTFWNKQPRLYDTQFQSIDVPVSISQPQESGSGLKFSVLNFDLDLNPHFHEDRSNSNATQVSNLSSSTSAPSSAASAHYHNYESSSIQDSLASDTINLTPVFQPEHSEKNRALLVRSVLIFAMPLFQRFIFGWPA